MTSPNQNSIVMFSVVFTFQTWPDYIQRKIRRSEMNGKTVRKKLRRFTHRYLYIKHHERDLWKRTLILILWCKYVSGKYSTKL
jgi:hypothetical protein